MVLSKTMETQHKIKIVFGVNDFLVGGMQRQFSEQIGHFNREKFDITLITLFEFPEKENFYAALPADLPVYRFAFKGWWDFHQWLDLYRLLRIIKPHIVVSSLFFGNTVFRLLRPFFGYTSIAREHNTYIHKSCGQQLIDRFLSLFSYRIIAVSKTVATFTTAQEHISPEKFVVIHNGIDLVQAQNILIHLPQKEVIRQELGFASAETVFLNVARLTSQKNHQILIEGFARFHEKNPKALLVIVGDGSLRLILEKKVRNLGLVDSVLFFGMRSDVWRFYKAADALISVSMIEGFSNVYLEALVAGLPIVSTLTAGTDEFLVDGYNGYIVDEQTIEGVNRALERIDISKLEELKKHASETAERFSIQRAVSAYERLFEEAIKNSHHVL